MRKITTIATIIVLTLSMLSSGTFVRGLVCTQIIQSEEIQETKLLNKREQIYGLARVEKQRKSSYSVKKETYTFVSKNLHKEVSSPIFSSKNSFFIRYCSLLI